MAGNRFFPPRVALHLAQMACEWFSTLQRKRLRVAAFASREDMQAIMQCIVERRRQAHPFNWSTKSVAKVRADTPLKKAA
jgi:hypothetical protein